MVVGGLLEGFEIKCWFKNFLDIIGLVKELVMLGVESVIMDDFVCVYLESYFKEFKVILDVGGGELGL